MKNQLKIYFYNILMELKIVYNQSQKYLCLQKIYILKNLILIKKIYI